MIEARGITHHYGIRPVVKNVDVSVRSGELVVILGPNGMGKSTLLGVMAGVLAPRQGYVEINGLRRRSSAAAELQIRRQSTYLPDHPWLPLNRTGREFLMGVGGLYGIDDIRVLNHVELLLKLFELEREGDWPIRSYSNGQQKKIAVCSALVTETPVMFLDEPFSGGLDPSGIFALKRVLRRLVEQNGATVVMTAPVPELVEELADRVLILRAGQVAAFDAPAELRRQAGDVATLAEALERLVDTDTVENLAAYFVGRSS
jgi:ABC-type multidrug transport system ATPase subunit